jgi:hypothetical protein
MNRRTLAVACALAFTVFRGGPSVAEDAPAGKASKAAPPAVVVSKEDAAAGDEMVREARSFLTLVRDGAEDKAYERMSADFRKEHTAEQFAKDLGDFRDKAPLPPSVSVSGEVWLKPKDGGPPRASLRTGMSRGAMFTGGGRGASSFRSSFLTLVLVKEDGKWKVASLNDARANSPAVSMGKAPKVDRKDPDRFKVSSTFEGKLVKVEDGSIVLRVEGAKEGDPVSERTFKIDEQTPVANATETEATGGGPAGAEGKARRVTRMTRGTLADVKADRRASVETSEDGTRAEAVIVFQQSEAATPSEGL